MAPRVLHIVDPGVFDPPSVAGPCTLRLAADVIIRLVHMEHDVLLLGTRRDAKLAEACGLTVAAAYCPPRTLPLSGRKAVAKGIDALQRTHGEYAVVHGWTPRAAFMASIAVGELPRVASVNVSRQRPIDRKALRILLTQHRTQVVAPNDAVRQACRDAELPVGRMKVIEPAVDTSVLSSNDRVAMRRRWGIDDETFLVGALCEPACAADARIAVRVISSLGLTGRKVRMVLHGDAIRRVDAKWWAKQLRLENQLIFDDQVAHPWQIAPALDAAWVIAAVGGSTVNPAACLPMRWAMAAGVPIVAESASAAAQIITDQHNGLIVPPGEIPTILDRLAHIYDERQWGSAIGTAGREDLTKRTTIEQYASQLAELYQRDW